MSFGRYLSPLLIMITVVSCNNLDYKLTMGNDKVRIDCTLTRLEVRTVSEEDNETFGIASDKQSWVYGDIEITNLTTGDFTYNLESYHLALGEKTSSQARIDSFVDHLYRDETLEVGERYRKSVYWVFEGELSTSDTKVLKLIEKDKL